MASANTYASTHLIFIQWWKNGHVFQNVLALSHSTHIYLHKKKNAHMKISETTPRSNKKKEDVWEGNKNILPGILSLGIYAYGFQEHRFSFTINWNIFHKDKLCKHVQVLWFDIWTRFSNRSRKTTFLLECIGAYKVLKRLVFKGREFPSLKSMIIDNFVEFCILFTLEFPYRVSLGETWFL